jgi:hypothetical protein
MGTELAEGVANWRDKAVADEGVCGPREKCRQDACATQDQQLRAKNAQQPMDKKRPKAKECLFCAWNRD